MHVKVGEIVCSPLLQWAGKCKFHHDTRKPGITDPKYAHVAAAVAEVGFLFYGGSNCLGATKETEIGTEGEKKALFE